MNRLLIIGHATIAAVIYGVLHDQVTIRICPEYFTVAHPRLIHTESLTLLALFWGIIATWWVGLPFGLLLALAATVGSWPRLSPSQVRPRIGILLLLLAVLSGAAGLVAAAIGLGSQFREHAPELAAKIDPGMHNRFMVAWSMHVTSYIGGVLGGLALSMILVLHRRRSALGGG